MSEQLSLTPVEDLKVLIQKRNELDLQLLEVDSKIFTLNKEIERKIRSREISVGTFSFREDFQRKPYRNKYVFIKEMYKSGKLPESSADEAQALRAVEQSEAVSTYNAKAVLKSLTEFAIEKAIEVKAGKITPPEKKEVVPEFATF